MFIGLDGTQAPAVVFGSRLATRSVSEA